MTEALQIAIVGGGIGGLTAAVALRARGAKVTVFEQAEELREIGAGISLNPNAALLLRRLGLDKRLADIGTPMSGLNVRTSHGELSRCCSSDRDACARRSKYWPWLQRTSR